uniref:Uncharacterized protein n=1 Tax=Ciona savignyi TaxID=51511 RepID=H2ZR14_CIOSA
MTSGSKRPNLCTLCTKHLSSSPPKTTGEPKQCSNKDLKKLSQTARISSLPFNNNNRVGTKEHKSAVSETLQYMEPYQEEDWLKRWPYYIQIYQALSKRVVPETRTT